MDASEQLVNRVTKFFWVANMLQVFDAKRLLVGSLIDGGAFAFAADPNLGGLQISNNSRRWT